MPRLPILQKVRQISVSDVEHSRKVGLVVDRLVLRREARRRGIRLLLTFVRADFEGSMVKALRAKGWHCTRKTGTGQAGNRPDKQIRETPKWRFVCEVPAGHDRRQTTVEQWSA